MTPRYRAVGAAAFAAMVVTTSAGCGVGLDSLPLSAPGAGGSGYTIHANFANALNLPTKAKVRLAGADVGEVSGMAVHDYTAEVTLRIRQEVTLPVGTRAELRTATPLGDVFVSLIAPADATPMAAMRDGDRIPLQSTSAAATVEDVLTSASLLVNGGVFRNLSTVVNGLGRSVGDRGDRLGALLDQSTQLVQALSARSGDIRAALAETNRLVGELSAQQGTIDEFISAAGPAATTIDHNAGQVLAVVRQVDEISRQLAKFPAVQGIDTGGLIANFNRLAGELNDAATSPDASLYSLNAMLATILKATSSTAAHGDVDVADLAIGALPDPAHPGDPGNRVPDATDWQAFVGSLTYTLLKLRDRVLGPGR